MIDWLTNDFGHFFFKIHFERFSALRPNVFSWDDVVRRTPVERLDHAFTVAKDQLGIERLLDPEGMGSLVHVVDIYLCGNKCEKL